MSLKLHGLNRFNKRMQKQIEDSLKLIEDCLEKSGFLDQKREWKINFGGYKKNTRHFSPLKVLFFQPPCSIYIQTAPSMRGAALKFYLLVPQGISAKDVFERIQQMAANADRA